MGVLAHAATSGKAGSARYEARAASEAVAGTSADQRRIQSQYQRDVDRDRSRATQTLQFAADSTVLAPELKRQTDLLGVLRVVADVDGAVSRLVVLSDLHESMAGVGRRDFDRDPPSDAAEAQAWATEDVAVVTSTYGVDREVLSGVTVVPVRPSTANSEVSGVRVRVRVGA